jgi:exopolysaccharide production protein ExoQ
MPPQLALILCLLFIIYLYINDVRKEPKVSHALWIPLIWLLINGSRSVSEWLGINVHYTSADDYAEGTPLDRNIFSLLIAAGLFVLFRRNISWSQIVLRNRWIFIFVVYCGISILWSDFPLVATKRWVKAIGVLVMVLVVVTDQSPMDAIGALIRRWMYALIPLSVLLIKYFGEIGRSYDRWTGKAFYSGVGADKNALGYLCLISGFFCLWNLLTMSREKILFKAKNKLLLNALFLAMICWLLYLAQSSTSLGVLIAGSMFFMVMGITFVKRNPNLSILVGIVTGSILFWSFDVMGFILSALDRDVTLTGRTDLWKDLVEIGTDPLIGVGYESFWLGGGAEQLWKKYWWHPVQAHNGYLEIYMNLGVVGLLLLLGIIIAAYRNGIESLVSGYEFGKFQLAFVGMILLYNISESGFKALHPMWFVFLLLTIEWSRPREMVISKQAKSAHSFSS